MAIKKTALLLDDELVRQAKAVLSTGTTTDTMTEALRGGHPIQGRARHYPGPEPRVRMLKGAWRHHGDPPR